MPRNLMLASEDWYADQTQQEEKQSDEELAHQMETQTGEGKGMIGQGACRDEVVKTQRNYESEYARLAMQGGRKDLLCIDSGEDSEPRTPQRAPKQVTVREDDGEPVPESEYVKLAKQGGQKDLLCISENTKTTERVDFKPKSGDWYKHDMTPEASTNGHNNKITSNKFEHSDTTAKTQAKSNQLSSNSANGFAFGGSLPTGPEQEIRYGKKRFATQNERRDAPFATNF